MAAVSRPPCFEPNGSKAEDFGVETEPTSATRRNQTKFQVSESRHNRGLSCRGRSAIISGVVSWQASETQILLSRIYNLKQESAYREMEEEVQIALDRYPSNPQFQVLLAEARWRLGRRPEAEQLLDQLENEARALPDFHALKGATQLARQEYQAALESFRIAYSLKASPFFVKRQADCLLHLRRYEEALALLRQLDRSRPDAYLLSSMARAYEGLGQKDEAIVCYDRILQLRPGDSFARSRRIKLKAAEKDGGTARGELDRMLRLPSRRQDSALLRVKADQLKAQGQFAKAAEIYQKLVDLASDGERDFFQRSLAFAYYKAELYEEAYPLLCQQFQQRPQDPYLRSSLLTAGKRLGRTQELADFLFGLARLTSANRFLFGVARKLLAPATGPKSSSREG